MADNQFGIFKTVLAYSVFIILAPICTFFFTKSVIFEGILASKNTVSSNVWSAAAAIIVLHVGLGMYIFRAYSDAGKEKPEKDDKVD